MINELYICCSWIFCPVFADLLQDIIQGDPANGMFIVETGLVDVVKKNDNGEEKTVKETSRLETLRNYTVCFIKSYRNPVNKCTGLR